MQNFSVVTGEHAAPGTFSTVHASAHSFLISVVYQSYIE